MVGRLSQNNTGALEIGTCRNTSNCLIQSSSTEVVDKVRYSTSVEDLETVCCFLEDQDTGFGPRNTTNPVVYRQSFGSPAQSASLNVVKFKSPLL